MVRVRVQMGVIVDDSDDVGDGIPFRASDSGVFPKMSGSQQNPW